MQAYAAISPYQTHFSRPVGEVLADLDRYALLLTRWQRIQNLVSRETLSELWTRHIADSLQVLALLMPEDTAFLDIGSGGGLPAIPLAIALKGRDRVSFKLIEPNQRKASFLRTVARELELAVSVEGRRVQEIDSRETSPPDVITARALASLNDLCRLVAPLWGPQTHAIFHKGREHVEELMASRAHWRYDVRTVQSDTSPDGVLLELRHLEGQSTA